LALFNVDVLADTPPALVWDCFLQCIAASAIFQGDERARASVFSSHPVALPRDRRCGLAAACLPWSIAAVRASRSTNRQVEKFRDEINADTKPELVGKVVNEETELAAASLKVVQSFSSTQRLLRRS
jgi:hypothetical protein